MKILTLIIGCLFSTVLFSQQANLTGTVKDATTNEGLEFATIVLMKPDSTILKGCMTQTGGTFVLDGLTKGNYILRASFVGYKDKSMDISTTRNLHDVGDIFLEGDNTLEAAVVTASKPLIQQKIDRYIVSVPAYQSGRSAMDVLCATSGVIVQNKNISLISGEVQIWIDERPLQMSGEQLALFLESMQADDIEDIEVIANPSARYDAEGSGGIINIRLKKNKVDMFNGSVNAGYELSERHKGIGGISLNYRKGRINIFGNYNIKGGNDVSYIDELTTNTYADGTTQTYAKHLKSDTYRYLSNNYRAGVDLTLGKSNILGFLFNGFNNDTGTDPFSSTAMTPAINNSFFSEMDGHSVNKHNGQMYNVNFKRMFGKKGQEFSFDADYAHFSNKSSQNQTYSFFGSNSTPSEPEQSERNNLPQKNDVLSLKADYSQPIGKNATIETGAKVSNTKTDNNYQYEELNNGVWENVVGRSNYFKYEENIFAAYFNFSHKIGKWSYMVGVRAENTGTKGNQVSAGQKNKKSYLDWFPATYLQYIPQEKHTFTVSYRRRFNRPNYALLNPFEQVLDKYSFIRGNPNLNPGYGNIYDFKYTYAHKFTVNLNVTDLRDRVFTQPVTESDGRYGYTYKNFARRTAYVLQLNYNNTFFKIWRMHTMGQLAYIDQDAGKTNDDFENSGVMGFFMIYNNVELTKTFSFNLNFMMMPGSKEGYVKSENFMNNLSFGIHKKVLGNKGAVSINVNDIFKGLGNNTLSTYNNMRIKLNEKYNTRSVTFSFRYNFGSDKVKGARQRSIGINEEIERSTSK